MKSMFKFVFKNENRIVKIIHQIITNKKQVLQLKHSIHFKSKWH